MAVRDYYTCNGRIIGEKRSDEERSRDYICDPWGNVIAVYQADWQIAAVTYDPWGEQLSNWNASSYRYLWGGGIGYRQTNKEWATHYVRARHYSFMDGTWTTQDPLWPQEPAYRYVGNMVTRAVDPSGKGICYIGAAKAIRECTCYLNGRQIGTKKRSTAFRVDTCVNCEDPILLYSCSAAQEIQQSGARTIVSIAGDLSGSCSGQGVFGFMAQTGFDLLKSWFNKVGRFLIAYEDGNPCTTENAYVTCQLNLSITLKVFDCRSGEKCDKSATQFFTNNEPVPVPPVIIPVPDLPAPRLGKPKPTKGVGGGGGRSW